MAGRYNFHFDTGADVVATFTWLDDNQTPINITGYTAILTIDVPGATPNVVYTQSSGLTLGGVAGTIAFDVPGSVTSDWDEGVTYTLFLTSPGGIVYKLIYGDFVRAS